MKQQQFGMDKGFCGTGPTELWTGTTCFIRFRRWRAMTAISAIKPPSPASEIFRVCIRARAWAGPPQPFPSHPLSSFDSPLVRLPFAGSWFGSRGLAQVTEGEKGSSAKVSYQATGPAHGYALGIHRHVGAAPYVLHPEAEH